MWTDSKKWKALRAEGKHAVVRFDVFCGHCGKQLGESVDGDEIDKCGLPTYHPMEIFCDKVCAKEYQHATGTTLFSYGWRLTLA